MCFRYLSALTTALLLFPTAAHADASEDRFRSFYIETGVRLSHAQSAPISGAKSGRMAFVDSLSSSGLIVGYRPHSLASDTGSVNVELELTGRENSINAMTIGATVSDPNSKLAIGALMLNAKYEFRFGRLLPYFGGGVGIAAQRLRHEPGLNLTDNDSANSQFAQQLDAGIGFALTPRAVASIGYNYFTTSSPRYTTGAGAIRLGRPKINSVAIGLKYRL